MGAGGCPMCLPLTSFKGMRSWLDRPLLWAIFLSTTLQNAAVDCKRVRTNDLPPPNLNSSMNVVSMGQNVSLSCSSKNTSVDITYSLFLGRKHLQTKKRGETVTFYVKISNANETGPYKCKTSDSSGQRYSQEFNFTIARDAQKRVSVTCFAAVTEHLAKPFKEKGLIWVPSDVVIMKGTVTAAGAGEEESCPSCLLSQLLPGVLLGLLIIILVLVFLIRTKYKRGKAQRENESKGSGDAPMQGELYANICETQTEAGQPQELYYATPVFKEVAPREQEGHVGNKADCVYSDLTY